MMMPKTSFFIAVSGLLPAEALLEAFRGGRPVVFAKNQVVQEEGEEAYENLGKSWKILGSR